MRRLSTVLAMLASLGIHCWAPPHAGGGRRYATSNVALPTCRRRRAGHQGCPATATGLRDPNVCAHRWSFITA